MSVHNVLRFVQSAQNHVQAGVSEDFNASGGNQTGSTPKVLSVGLEVTVSTPANAAFTSANVNTANETIAVVGHGFSTGLRVQFTTSGTLPTGLLVATNYFIIKVSDDLFSVASSLANANAGTAIDLTAAGSGSSSANPVAFSLGTATLEKSLDGANFVLDGNPVHFTSSGVLSPIEKIDPAHRVYRLRYSVDAGQITTQVTVFGKGHV